MEEGSIAGEGNEVIHVESHSGATEEKHEPFKKQKSTTKTNLRRKSRRLVLIMLENTLLLKNLKES